MNENEPQWINKAQPMGQWHGGPYQAPRNTDFTGQLIRFGVRMGAAMVAYKGFQAGQAHWERTHDYEAATRFGLEAGRRYHTWYIFFLLWIMSLPVMFFAAPHMLGLIPAWVVGTVFTIGVPYVRCVNFSLGRRGMWYHIFRPVADRCVSVSNGVLYGIVPIVCLIFGLALS